jgi:chromosome segregation ATPase
VLRQLIEERYAIVTSLRRADAILRALPAKRRSLEQDITDAQQSIAHASAEYRRAQSVIDNHDRPLRRRKHEFEIAAARGELRRQPEIARRAEGAIEASESELARLAARGSEMKALVDRRPELDLRVAEIDGRLGHDLRVRTRIARLEPPTTITATLGPRPRDPREARQWDQAAGRLQQHQAAFGIHDGIGASPPRLDHSAYARSRAAVEGLMQSARTNCAPAIERASIAGDR